MQQIKLIAPAALSCLMLLLGTTLGAQPTGYVQRGTASYYAEGFHGRRTANGERYNKNAYTAAHRDLAFGTLVRITNLDNQHTVVVRVNDRGPFSSARIIDVSKAAAHRLGLLHSGTARVQIEVVGRDATRPDTATGGPRATGAELAENRPAAAPATLQAGSPPTQAQGPRPANPASPAQQPNPVANPAAHSPNAANSPHIAEHASASNLPELFNLPGTYSLQGAAQHARGKFGIQVGAFGQLNNAQELSAKINAKGYSKVYIQVTRKPDTSLVFKVIVGLYVSREAAAQNLRELKQKGIDGFVVAHL